MKSNQLLLQNLIDVNPRTGIIKLHDKRMALISVEALGILRNDLIKTLGKERAKGFLMRYGWACGKRAAESLKENYEWNSIKELLLSGTVVHTLEGIVTVEPDILEINQDRLYFTGFWKNSFETTNHLNGNGVDTEAICWTLIGYASGYLTSAFGEEVVAYEKTCRGKGDSDCYFIAQTVAHSNKEHLKDLRYYKAESLQFVLDDVYTDIERLNENIIESEDIQNQLIEIFLENKDVNEITRLIGDILGRSIVIDHFKEVYSSHFVSTDDLLAYNKWGNAGVLINQQDGLYFESFSIKSHKTLLGRLTVIGDKKLDQRDRLIINRALMVFTIQMHHKRKITESLWQKREDFFDDIINNKIVDEKSLKRKAAILGFKPNESHRILAIKVQPEMMNGEVLNFLSNRYTEIDIFIKDEFVVMIVAEDKEKNIEEMSINILHEIQSHISDVIIHIGSGRSVKSIQMIRNSYIDATRICDFVRLTYPVKSKQATYKELEGVMMFLKGADHKELINFYINKIGSLIKYDKENAGNLLITLNSYLDNNGNLQQTANDLHLSIAGLRYRIERIESLCDIDLKTGSGRFNGQLATRIYFALKVVEQENVIF